MKFWNSETTLIIKEIFEKIGKPPCLFCRPTIKDSYEHARSGKCECTATNMSLHYLYASASEAIRKVGPCIPPERWTPPCPKWTPQYDHQIQKSLLISLRNASRLIIHEEANIGEIFKIKANPPNDMTIKHLDRINALLTNYPNGRIEYHLARKRWWQSLCRIPQFTNGTRVDPCTCLLWSFRYRLWYLPPIEPHRCIEIF